MQPDISIEDVLYIMQPNLGGLFRGLFWGWCGGGGGGGCKITPGYPPAHL